MVSAWLCLHLMRHAQGRRLVLEQGPTRAHWGSRSQQLGNCRLHCSLIGEWRTKSPALAGFFVYSIWVPTPDRTGTGGIQIFLPGIDMKGNSQPGQYATLVVTGESITGGVVEDTRPVNASGLIVRGYVCALSLTVVAAVTAAATVAAALPSWDAPAVDRPVASALLEEPELA